MIDHDTTMSAQAIELAASATVLPKPLAAVLDYWREARGGRFAPAFGDFRLVDLPGACIPQTIVIDLHEPDRYDPAKARFRFFGTLWVETSAQEVTGKTVDQFMPPSVQTMLSGQYRRVLEARSPVAFSNTLPTPKGLLASFAMLRMPLSTDGKRIDKIVSVSRFEESRRDLQEAFETNLDASRQP